MPEEWQTAWNRSSTHDDGGAQQQMLTYGQNLHLDEKHWVTSSGRLTKHRFRSLIASEASLAHARAGDQSVSTVVPIAEAEMFQCCSYAHFDNPALPKEGKGLTHYL